MGLIYELVDVARGEAYTLGKGCWTSALGRAADRDEGWRSGAEWLVVPEDDPEAWLDKFESAYGVPIDREGIVRAALEAWFFCARAEWRVEIRNDGTDYRDEVYEDFVRVSPRTVGSLYEDDVPDLDGGNDLYCTHSKAERLESVEGIRSWRCPDCGGTLTYGTERPSQGGDRRLGKEG